MAEQAIEKLEKERRTGAFGPHAGIMKDSVCAALVDFCGQNEAFAQAVVQGGSFGDCMKAVEKNCGSGISDLEAYRRAVRFYFPKADVQFHMTIELPSGTGGKAEEKEPVVLDLADFL